MNGSKVEWVDKIMDGGELEYDGWVAVNGVCVYIYIFNLFFII